MTESLETPTGDSADISTASVSLRIPEFIPDDPELWLAQLEAQFRTARISAQQQRFSYLAASLPRHLASDVRDILIHPPETNPYDALKKALLVRTTCSEEKRLRQLLSGISLGDRKPTQLLRHMKQLAGNVPMDDAFLRQIWVQALPESTQSILSVLTDKLSLDDLAASADRVLECSPVHVSSATSSIDRIKPVDNDQLTQKLIKQVQSLTLEVKALKAQRSRSRSRNRSTSRHLSTPGNFSGICWYHRRFKERATRCTKPCTYKSPSGNDRASM